MDQVQISKWIPGGIQIKHTDNLATFWRVAHSLFPTSSE
jgi:hypothetical protein